MTPAVASLEGKVAVVTGASSGIGQSVALCLARAGADVASIHLPGAHDAAATADGVLSLGRNTLMVEGSTADPRAVEEFATRVERELGPIHVWVNNAAQILVRPFLEMDDTQWHHIMASNLHGYYHGCRAALRRMSGRGVGVVVNISSITATQPIADMSAYITAKGAVVGMTRALALEFAPLGIRVNAVAPGATETALTSHIYTPEVRATYERRIAAGRIGVPDDIGEVVAFLASDSARYIVGQEIVVDGGMTLNGNVGFAADPPLGETSGAR